MEHYEIIIMVLGCNNEPFITIENEGIRKTWINNCPPNVKIIFYYGDSNQSMMINDKLYLPVIETMENIGYKTIEALKFIKNKFSFDYIFRTNISSYVDINLLLEFIKEKPKEKYYNGIIVNHQGIILSSGAGYFLTPDLVDLIITNETMWDHSYIDDVALGLFLKNFGISPVGDMQRFDVVNNSYHIPNNFYHYRLKNWNDRYDDINRFHMVHNSKGFKLKNI